MNTLQNLRPVIQTLNSPSAVTSDNIPSAERPQPSDAAGSTRTPPKGIHVDISTLGRQKLAEKDKDKDIDDSDMPPHVKQTLKMLRRYQERLAEKQQELAQMQQDHALQGEAKEEQLKLLRTEVADLQRIIGGMKGELVKAAEKLNFTAEQMRSLSSLIGN